MKSYTVLAILLLSAPLALPQPPDRAGLGPQGPGGGRMGRGPGGMRPSVLRNALDADHDGIISASEIQNAPAALKALDKNGDGMITPDEIRPPQGPGPGGPGGPEGERRREGGAPPQDDDMVATLMRFDKNGDGKLTKDELPERMQGLFDRGDTNKDGVLTAQEIRQMSSAQQQQQRQGNDQRENERGGGPREAFNQLGFIMRDPIYMALDTDHDGKISAAEIAAAPKSLLALDKNHDGQLTVDELMPAGPPPGGGFGGSPQEMANRMFEQFDANKDGKLTRDEIPERMQDLFDSIASQNPNKKTRGFITPDQLAKALAERQQQQRQERQ